MLREAGYEGLVGGEVVENPEENVLAVLEGFQVGGGKRGGWRMGGEGGWRMGGESR